MKVVVAVLIALCTLSLALVPSHAQTWTPYAPVPSGGTGVEGMYGGTYDGFIIAAYGNDDVLGDTVTTRIYNVVNTCFGPADTWTAGPDAPDPIRAEGVGVVSGRYFYAIGGRFAGVLANLERFDARADCLGGWTTLTPMPTPRAGLAAAVVKNAIYAIGGRDSGGGPCSGPATDVVEKYNIGTGMWSAVAPLPSPRSDLAAIAPGNGKIYVFGGCNGNLLAPFDLVNVYDPVTDTWSPDFPGLGALANMPTARSSLVVGKIKTKIYAIGGIDNTGSAVGTNEAFDYGLDMWSPALDMPTPRGEAIAASRKDPNGLNAIYVIGGAQPAFGNQVDDNEAFTIP